MKTKKIKRVKKISEEDAEKRLFKTLKLLALNPSSHQQGALHYPSRASKVKGGEIV